MQEGTSSLMQMAKVSVAVDAMRREGLPFIAVLNDPTYGGVSASYAMQADVKIALSDARIGFAGPAVILNTMCDADQGKYDEQCPPDFQSASYLLEKGQVDKIVDVSDKKDAGEIQTEVERQVAQVAALLIRAKRFESPPLTSRGSEFVASQVTEDDKRQPFNYTNSRKIDRPQVQDLINTVFENFFEMSGDGRVGRDACIRGGLATFRGRPCIVMGTFKGHTPHTMQEANYGMASPHGYRFALRLMQMAERFGMFVVTLVDTVGAWPTFECERDGQSEAIATNLTGMAGLRVPIVTLMVGEGGSGGALGIGMGNSIGMLSGGYFGVISPEGAASILGRYKSDAEKAQQFPLDCQELATAQCIYAYQLKEIGVVDEIIWECSHGESFEAFPILKSRIEAFIDSSLASFEGKSAEEIISHRYEKFRTLGTFTLMDEEERLCVVNEANERKTPPRRQSKPDTMATPLIEHLAYETVNGTFSRHRGLAPQSCEEDAPIQPTVNKFNTKPGYENAKSVLDARGPEALALWVKENKKVLLTDTTMRDAHQSLVATRVRTEDLVKGAAVANELLKDAFSFECWGGATFDVCMRFLDECPWERLRELRAAAPHVCLQMLIRGANAVGYTSYPDNVVVEFIRLAAENGMDVFRIFDCFNIVDNMKVAIDAVRAASKVAEVCLCYTGNIMTSSIYNADYYRVVAKEAAEAGAHIIGIKDMSGLLRPLECTVLLEAIRSVTDLPIHFHTHSTSSGSIAVCMEMARLNCDIIDLCTASMADGTSQPSLNAFVAMMEGADNDPGVNFLTLEPYDMYWSRVRDMYSPFESGMKSGSARVWEHQIPGGQYSNLYAQCKSMGLWDQWETILDTYRDVNILFGDVIKVTPSSKCVGDLALYLVNCKLTTKDLLNEDSPPQIDFPESVVSLMRGDLGFPHRGFPKSIEKMILKGSEKRTQRAGLVLPPANFEENRRHLSEEWGVPISPEMGMSSLMYPKVFSDFMKRRKEKGLLLRYLPTPVYFYAMKVGQKFTISVPATLAAELTKEDTKEKLGFEDVDIALKRVGPLARKCRTVVFSINGSREQHVSVKDSTAGFEFLGPMADTSNVKHVASPMPGAVEKVLVEEGQAVEQGEVLFIVGAMKMEVKTSASTAGKIGKVEVSVGTRVVEGALLTTIH